MKTAAKPAKTVKAAKSKPTKSAALKTARSKSKSAYDVHPSVAMVQKAIGVLKEKTGRTMDEWIAFIKKSGPKDDAARREWLKTEHGLGTNYAWWLADWAAGRSLEDGDPAKYLEAAAGYVEEMYSGGKAGLRPLHEALIALGRASGKDVKVCPCTTIVPLFREHVFAQIKPSTRTRIDFGLALAKHKGAPKLPKRLIDTGGMAKKDRITHKFEITLLDDIDDEVKKWLEIAYELDAPE